jgi:sugar phosphate isomerase/epimerase
LYAPFPPPARNFAGRAEISSVPTPKLAAFPKAFMDELCVEKTMSVFDWIDLAATLDIDGVELYAGFLESDPAFLVRVRAAADSKNLQIPMLCCSPDFTAPDLDAEIEKQKGWIEMCAALGGRYCRTLSGQRRPELSIEEGVRRVAGAVEASLPLAESLGVTLIIENHYKDNYWTHPEFAQRSEVLAQILERVAHPNFAVNYDPSNAYLAGEDPLDVLEKVRHRVVTMHASDRYLTHGTIEDLRREENSPGYAARLSHGVIGEGLNDFDAIFSQIRPTWVSIEDGMNGMDDLKKSVAFLRQKLRECYG